MHDNVKSDFGVQPFVIMGKIDLIVGHPKSYMLHGHVHNTGDQILIDNCKEFRDTKRRIQGKEQGIPCYNCFVWVRFIIDTTQNGLK